jgi:glycosyltransferase involved in cell wall biosynthesis
VVSLPALSVVVPTYRRPELLRRCLDSLDRQNLPRERFEVIVVDDGSGDETAGVLDRAGVVALAQPRNAGPAAARNRGVAQARGRLVLFLDDDVAATPDLLSTHLALHDAADDRLLGVLGRVDWDPALTVTPFMRWLDRSGLQFGYETWLREGPVDPPYAAFYTANLSMHRDLLDEVGGFDERFPYAAFEDMELAFRLAAAGFHLDYRPAAQAFHTRSMDLPGFSRRMEKVGESAELLRRAAPDFPLDDDALRERHVSWARRTRLRLAGRRDDDARRQFYWAQVAAAYDRGRRRATH